MDFHYSSQLENVDQDDIFYAELRRQILLLTADEDEALEDSVHRKHASYVHAKEKISNSITNPSPALAPGSYFNWWESTKSDSAPSWMVNLWRNGNNGNGTGVFIPYIVKARRYKAGKPRNARAFRQVRN